MSSDSLIKRHAPPKASAMLEALRGLGYNPATALADLVDNCICARAATVAIEFQWEGEASTVTVFDDGEGMTPSGLDSAMRLGEKNPLEERQLHDLGRFGLGLKTASFSQCRRLTVASRNSGVESCLRWDLDVLAQAEDDGWHLLEGPAGGSEKLLQPLENRSHGTIVIWEVLDRIVTEGFTEQDFLDLIDRIEQHIAMVFHRYLEGPIPRLRILINNKPVKPWNPFLIGHPATWSSPVDTIQTNAGQVEVQCHVLPHRDRLKEKDYEIYGGPEGWTAQQGFYIYRNHRLLVAGSWLGLGQGRCWTKEEAHRLARIRLDIPNTADGDWKIDIRKSTARPPVVIRGRLTRLAEDARKRARQVFAHRGHAHGISPGNPLAEAWRAEYFPGGMRYRIDHDHPAVSAVLDDAGENRTQVLAMLRVIEETVPVQRIWLDTTEGKEVPRTGFSEAASTEVASVLETMFRNMVNRKGMSPALAKEQLCRTEPFQEYPDLVAALPEEW